MCCWHCGPPFQGLSWTTVLNKLSLSQHTVGWSSEHVCSWLPIMSFCSSPETHGATSSRCCPLINPPMVGYTPMSFQPGMASSQQASSVQIGRPPGVMRHIILHCPVGRSLDFTGAWYKVMRPSTSPHGPCSLLNGISNRPGGPVSVLAAARFDSHHGPHHSLLCPRIAVPFR